MSDAGIQPSAATGLRPVPDPTVLTTEQIQRAVAAERDYVNGQLDVLRERLTAIDKATELLNETINRTPTDIDKEIAHLRELADERFSSVDHRLMERKAMIDAAFAAQKEAAANQDRTNQKAIDKAEQATNESIGKLGEVIRASTDGLADKIEDIKGRLSTLESMLNGYAQNKAGGQESTRERRDSNAALIATIGIAVTLILATIAIVGFLAANASP